MIKSISRAKINLYLHIIKQRDDGFHLLDSLVSFAQIGDIIEVFESDKLTLEIVGEFASDLSSNEDNLIHKSAIALADKFSISANAHIKLTKNLPIGAGIGGGSGDSAVTLKLLNKLWKLNATEQDLHEIALPLGSDIPVCLYNDNCRISGIGEVIKPIKLPHIPLILVNPKQTISSAQIYRKGIEKYSGQAQSCAEEFHNIGELAQFLQNTNNDLYPNALAQAPILSEVLQIINAQKDCLFANMSGSGSTCFGIFSSDKAANAAIGQIKSQHPNWWCA